MSDHIFKDKVSKDWLKSVLRNETVTLTFVKKDGSERVMVCTLNENKIPEEKMPKVDKEEIKKRVNEDVQPVFDLVNNDWRSFRWESVKKIEFTLGE